MSSETAPHLLIDMNLSPSWVAFLKAAGIEAMHWSTVGDPRATDETVMSLARDRGLVVFTHDLDFSALLAATGARGPSVIQLRSLDVMPAAVGTLLVDTLRVHARALSEGAIVTIDESAARVRILPIRRER